MQKKMEIINQIKNLVRLLNAEEQQYLFIELFKNAEYQRMKKSDSQKPWVKFGKWPGNKWNREECYESRIGDDRY